MTTDNNQLEPLPDHPMALDDAVKLDARIRRLAEATGRQVVQVGQLLDEAKRGQIHQVLMFPSWTAYVADVVSGMSMQLSGGSRQAMVELMSAEGMSVRAISTATGVSKSTVARDLSAPVPNGTPRSEPVAAITGTDGKTYPRPTLVPPTTPRRPPNRPAFPTTVTEVVRGLYKPVVAVQKLTEDDRFANYAKSDDRSGRIRRQLLGVIEALQQVVDKLPDDGSTGKFAYLDKTGAYFHAL